MSEKGTSTSPSTSTSTSTSVESLASETATDTASIARVDESELRTLVVLVSLLTLGLVDTQLVGAVLPEIAASYGVSDGDVGRTVSGYAVAAAIAALLIGPLSDRSGRRRFLLAAGVLFTAGSAAVVLAPSFPLFVLARIVTGAGAGIISALVVAAIADAVPYSRRGRAMGHVGAAYFAAPILGVPLAAYVGDAFGWRTNYALFGAAGLLCGLSVRAWFHEEHAPTPRTGRSSRLALYAGFMRSGTKAAGAISAFFVTGGLTGFLLYLGAYLRARFSLSLSEIGSVFFLCGLGSLLGAAGAGRLADRVGKRPLVLTGSLVLGAALLVVPRAAEGFSTYAVLALVGLSAAARVAPLQALVTELVTKEERGAYVALRNTFSQGGNAVAAALGAYLFERGGFTLVCYVTAFFSLCAFVLLLMLKEPPGETVV